jgi:gluconolactonase
MALTLTVADQRLLELVDPQADLEVVADGFGFIEGPVWHDGRLIFSDIPGDQLLTWSPAAGVEVFRRPSHQANGNTLDRSGRLITCEHATSRVVREGPDGRTETIADTYEGRELNSPNDVVVTSDGSIWFTDPPFGRMAIFGDERARRLDFSGVFRLDPSGRLALVTARFATPNGLCFSADERSLFVNDTSSGQIWAFDVSEDRSVGPGRLWATTQGEGRGAPDGMKVDARGNLWCTGPGGVHVFDDAGTWLGVVHTERNTANFQWGGDRFDQLFLCSSDRLYRLTTLVTGRAPGRGG